jgi:GDP-L-fucose synthase
MKILITGGNGYIAKSIKYPLSKFYNITSISRKDFDLENLDLLTEWLKDKNFDVIIHTAMKGVSRLKNQNEQDFKANLKMFNNIIMHKNKFKKLIFFGSGAELHMQETYYGKSKKLINEIIEKENNFYNIRIFAVFDENELSTRFIKSNILRYINQQPILLHANKLMDFFYMKDLIKLIKYYIDNDNLQKQIDCSYKYKKSLIEIADYINTLNNYKVPINLEKDVIVEDYCGTSNLPIDVIGLEKGIKEVYNKLTFLKV